MCSTTGCRYSEPLRIHYQSNGLALREHGFQLVTKTWFFLASLTFLSIVIMSWKLHAQHNGGSGGGKVNMDNDISVDCKLLKGSDLARTFGFPEKLGKERAVYALGFVRNSTAKTAYVRFSIDGGDTIPGGIAEVTVGMVPPRGSAGEPFLVRLSNLVFGEGDLDVDKIKPVIHILETKYK